MLFVPTQEVRDLDFATDAAKMIHSMGTRWEELSPNELKILIQLMEKLVLFLCRKEGELPSNGGVMLECHSTIIIHRSWNTVS